MGFKKETQTQLCCVVPKSTVADIDTLSGQMGVSRSQFSKKAKINNLIFLSDYRDASFGKASGLLIKENRLLAREVFVLDKNGVLRYKELVFKLAELPDMEKAFKTVQSLL